MDVGKHIQKDNQSLAQSPHKTPELTETVCGDAESPFKSENKEEQGQLASNEISIQNSNVGLSVKKEAEETNSAGPSTSKALQDFHAKCDTTTALSPSVSEEKVRDEYKPAVKCETEDFGPDWHYVGSVFGSMVRKQHGGCAITELIESSPNMYLRLKRGDSSYNFYEIKVYTPDDTFLGTLDRDLDEMLALTMDCGWSRGRGQLGSNPMVYKTAKYKTKEFVDIEVHVYLKQDLIDNPYQLWPDDQFGRRGLKWLKRRLGEDDEGQEIIGNLLSSTRAGKHPYY